MSPARDVVARRALVIVVATLLVDLVALILAFQAAELTRIERLHENATEHVITATIPVWLVVLFMYGLYSRRHVIEPALRAGAIISATLVSVVLTIVISFVFVIHLARGWVAMMLIFAVIFLLAGRLLTLRATEAANRAGWLGIRTLVIGNNGEARTLARILRKKRHLGFDVIGYVGQLGAPEVDGLPVLASVDELRETVIANDVAAVFAAGSDTSPEVLNRIDKSLTGLHVRIRTSLGLPHLAASRVVVRDVDGMAMLALERATPSELQTRAKRALDIGMSAFGLLVASPVMLVIGLAIKLSDGGPVFFAQRRVGAGGEHFTMYKFRTMVVHAEKLRADLEQSNEAAGVLFKMRRDPRVTRVGRHLRQLGLDELPQLFNILVGEMSLVGPRPALPEEMEHWTHDLALRLKAKPGLTGLWQVSGRHELAFEDYVRYDLFYVENWSLALDLQIIARTVPALLSRAGAY